MTIERDGSVGLRQIAGSSAASPVFETGVVSTVACASPTGWSTASTAPVQTTDVATMNSTMVAMESGSDRAVDRVNRMSPSVTIAGSRWAPAIRRGEHPLQGAYATQNPGDPQRP